MRRDLRLPPELPPHLGKDARDFVERLVAIDDRRKLNGGKFTEPDKRYMEEAVKFLDEYGKAIGI